MHRRNFIRILGGGCIALTTLPMAGCNSSFPDEAVAAWAGPSASAPLVEWALAWALLSPSAHNLQPWLVDLKEPDAISLYVDRERLLPATDPWYRQIMVSQGCFIEALRIALHERGMETQLELFPSGAFPARTLSDQPVARIRWQRGATVASDPLFAQLSRRHTAKEAFDTTRVVAPERLQELLAASRPDGVDAAGSVEGERVAELRRLCMAAADVEISTPATVLESQRLMRIGPDEILRHRDGLSLNSPAVRAIAALGMLDRSQVPPPDSMAYTSTRKHYADACLSAMGFVWLSTAPGRVGEVEAGRAWLRLQLQAMAMGLQLHPLSQALQEFPEMDASYQAMHQTLLGKAPAQRVVQMLGRIGYGTPPSATPRRELRAIIRA